MSTKQKRRQLNEEYRFPGFQPSHTVKGIFGDPKARVITLRRRSKKQPVAVAVENMWDGTTARYGAYGTYLAAMPVFIWRRKSAEYFARIARL